MGREEAAMNDAILQEISDFCRQVGLAESTFGRRAVNDGKLASRLRNGVSHTCLRIAFFSAFRSCLVRPLLPPAAAFRRPPQSRHRLSDVPILM